MPTKIIHFPFLAEIGRLATLLCLDKFAVNLLSYPPTCSSSSFHTLQIAARILLEFSCTLPLTLLISLPLALRRTLPTRYTSISIPSSPPLALRRTLQYSSYFAECAPVVHNARTLQNTHDEGRQSQSSCFTEHCRTRDVKFHSYLAEHCLNPRASQNTADE